MRSLPSLFLLSAAGVLISLSGCGDPQQQDCARTCNGCCSDEGVCLPGNTQAACGTFGGLCNACAPTQQCQLGGCAFVSGTGGGSGGGTTGGGSGGGAMGGGSGGGGGGGCVAATCQMLGANCGEVSDQCGGMLSCGACQGTETCGGGGTPNVCGMGTCMPTTCALQAKNCGTISDGCSGTLNCGACQSPEVCGASNVCVTTCVPRSCAMANATCGSPADGCGGQLSCGTCTSGTCGGGGVPFTCGAMCMQSCPSGYSCNSMGVCAGGNQGNVTLNVVQAPTVAVSGIVTLNGAQPTSGCSSSDRATITFTSAMNSNYNTSVVVPCNGATTPFAWSAQLYPSTYSVSVRGGLSNLPSWSVVVNPSFTVTGPQSGVTLNVVQAPTVAVSGTVTLNGAQPTSGCSSSDRATVTFTSAMNSNYNTSVVVPCNGATTPFAWSAQLYPSTYSVSVRGGLSNLPSWSIVVNPSFTVTGPQSGVTLNVVQAPTVAVSGNVTLNGLQPTSGCSSSDRATVTFTSAMNSNYNTSVVVPCNGATTPFAWSAQLYPATYSVSVRGGLSNLPNWSVVVNPSFTVSGPQSNVTLNVVQAPTVAVSGTVTLNGAQPTSGCSSSDRATVTFTSAMNSNYNTSVVVPCNGATTPFAWNAQLYPSTYSVSVRGGLSNLPSWSVVVNPSFTVTGPQSNVTLNVVQAPTVAVSGLVTLNGAQPTSGCSSSDRATVTFTSAMNSNYNTSVVVPCNGATTPFAWNAQLYPSTYSVAVRGGLSNLPNWSVVVNPSFTVTGPQSGVALNVVQAPAVTVSGVITLNGMQPTSGCSSSDRATVTFTSAMNSNYNTSVVVPCNGGTTPFAWTAQLYPSTYSVRVRGGLSNLPSWSIVVVDALEVR